MRIQRLVRRSERSALTGSFVASLVSVSIGPLTADRVAAQQPVRQVSLDRPTATFPESFSLILSVRELADGRVLVADPLEKRFVALDFDTGQARELGSEGSGPDQYRQPDAVWSAGEGRSLLVDLGNARIVDVAEDGTFADTHPLTVGTPGPSGNFQVRIPGGVDGRGRVYFRAAQRLRFGGEQPTHEVIYRWNRATNTVDSLAAAKIEAREVNETGGEGDRRVSIRRIPFAPRDGWAVGQDGRLAIARAEPYRLEWIEPDGASTLGPEVDYEPVRIRQADKEEWVESSATAGISMSVSIDNGVAQTSLARGGESLGPSPAIDAYTWREVKPAFNAGGVHIDTRGRAWVRRYGPAGEPTSYDVFDASGSRIFQVTLGPDRHVVGFGSATTYVIRTDDLDLAQLERYALP